MLGSSIATVRRIAIAAGLTAAAACGHLGMGGSSQPDGFIVFRNESLDQADVFAVAPGLDLVRIGTVFPGRADTLRVRNSILNSGAGVNIVARLLARSNTPSSGVIPLHGGEFYEVRLSSDGRTLSVLPTSP